MFKEFRTLDWAGVSVPLGGQKAHLEEELGITFRAFGAGWRYDWQSDGMLSRVIRPDGKEVSFAYDALGRRTEKTYEGITTHFVWDGNVPLHEWQEVSSDTEKADITTWLFEQNTFIPAAKLAANGESFSIVSDYLGTPLQAFDNNGNKVWEQELDIFGRKRRKGNNNSSFIPFKYQGQYEDVETGLYYNRFRYYEPNKGTYISQDPIGLWGGHKLYAYVHNPNYWLDEFGLNKGIPFTDSNGLTLEVINQQDLSHMSVNQLEYMKKEGVAGTTKGGRTCGTEKIVLHHQKQNPSGPIIEMPVSKHSIGNKKQHPFGNKKGTGVGQNRLDFNNWRKEYWQNRARQELKKRKKSNSHH